MRKIDIDKPVNPFIKDLPVAKCNTDTLNTGLIYLISDGEYYKIGFTSKEVNLRIIQLQTGNPNELYLVHSEPGSIDDEQNIHLYFKKYKIRNEWFKIPSPIISDITLNGFRSFTTTNSTFKKDENHLKLFMVKGIEEIFDMSRGAVKLLLNVGKKLQWNQDLVSIKTSTISKELNMSNSSVTNSINILVDNGFLCKYKRGYYWINPQLIFNGDRLKTYPNNLKQL